MVRGTKGHISVVPYSRGDGNQVTVRQANFIDYYTKPDSESFSNAYRSARRAGYSDQTSRNLTHLKPKWLSETIGQLTSSVIKPEEITGVLTHVIYTNEEPTIIKLKAIELMMKYYKMLSPQNDNEPVFLNVKVDLSSGPRQRGF